MFKQKWLWIVTGISVAMVGCVHSKMTYLADGNKGYQIKCDGFMNSWTSCLVKAGRMCGRNGYSINFSDEVNREMLVECKLPNEQQTP